MASSVMTISDEAEHGNSAQMHKILIDIQKPPSKCHENTVLF